MSLLRPIIEKLESLSGTAYFEATTSFRVITDRVRAATFLALDGVKPSNKEQGYVLRRLLHWTIRYAVHLGIERQLFDELLPVVVSTYSRPYPELEQHRFEITDVFAREERAFGRTLSAGLKRLREFECEEIDGTRLFMMYDTFGFPVELAVKEAIRMCSSLSPTWQAEFDKKMAEQRSRTKGAGAGSA